MEELLKKLDTIFAMARVKQVELNPTDEKSLIEIINIKKDVFELIKKTENATKTD